MILISKINNYLYGTNYKDFESYYFKKLFSTQPLVILRAGDRILKKLKRQLIILSIPSTQ
jgi:uncharacterized membrane protein YcaP (DUF421 family)